MSDTHDRREAAEIGELIRRCMDGVATDVEAAELDRLVAGDPKVAGELVIAARLESGLEVLFRADPGALAAPPPPSDIARARPRRSLWLAAGGIAAAAAAVALIWSPRAPVPDARQAAAVDSNLRPGPSRPAVDDTPPPASKGRSDLGRRQFFSDGSLADLRDESSRLEIRVSTATAMDIALTKGAARFEIAPRPDRRFRIWVAAAYVEVIGTVFTVERLATGMRVSVERGKVKVVSGKKEVLLSGGAAEVIAVDLSEARTAERPRSRAHQPGPITGPTVAKDVPGALLLASEEARRRGRPDEALTLLRQFLDIHRGDPRAPYAAFILGRVLLEELGRPREAAAAFARVEALNPGTPLVQDALAREVESWSRAGDVEKARQRGSAYLGRYPNGQRAPEVRRHGQME